MRRRELLAGAVGLGTVGVGLAVATDRLDFGETDRVAAVDLPRIDAPGSDPGTETVPHPGQVTLVEFFATWCGVCESLMPTLAEVADGVGDAQFVSVTNEPLTGDRSSDDVARWWADNGGTWPVAHDEELTLTQRLDASGVPYSVVLDANNRVTYTGRGEKSADELLAAVDEARDG